MSTPDAKVGIPKAITTVESSAIPAFGLISSSKDWPKKKKGKEERKVVDKSKIGGPKEFRYVFEILYFFILYIFRFVKLERQLKHNSLFDSFIVYLIIPSLFFFEHFIQTRWRNSYWRRWSICFE